MRTVAPSNQSDVNDPSQTLQAAIGAGFADFVTKIAERMPIVVTHRRGYSCVSYLFAVLAHDRGRKN
jgi:hypothetical protein